MRAYFPVVQNFFSDLIKRRVVNVSYEFGGFPSDYQKTHTFSDLEVDYAIYLDTTLIKAKSRLAATERGPSYPERNADISELRDAIEDIESEIERNG